MKKEIIQELYNGFEAAAVEVKDVECWSARELQLLLGYSKWENFSKVIDKAKMACANTGSFVAERVCQNVHILFFYAQSPDFLKPGLCYFLKFLYL